MRKLLFVVWCIGGLTLFGLGMRAFLYALPLDMTIGFGLGVMWMAVLYLVNEKIDISEGRRDPNTGARLIDAGPRAPRAID